MATNVAELLVETLVRAGVKRVLGVVGDSLNGITDAIRRHEGIEWIGVRHEKVAAFAVGAEAHLTGTLAVCAGSCGPGHVHLINGLYDCHRSRVPVLAIAAHVPSAEIGTNYFQETRPELLFRDCSSYCETISHPAQAPRVFEIAMQMLGADFPYPQFYPEKAWIALAICRTWPTRAWTCSSMENGVSGI